MSTQITPELKARYMALYWKQAVFSTGPADTSTNHKVDGFFIEKFPNYGFVSLRSFDSLMDEELLEIQKIAKLEPVSVTSKELCLDASLLGSISICDYLRSISIALPYMGIPVPEWEAAGVVVIRKEG